MYSDSQEKRGSAMTKRETGLIGGSEKRAIEIVDYRTDWPAVFQAQAEIIAQALSSVALRIEHIGSTSVPGLAAKPIIDILVVVADAAAEDSYLPQMEAVGYELRVREPEFHEHRMFRTPDRDVHVHFYSAGSPEIARNLTFRDRLRDSSADRRLYEITKRELAVRPWEDMNAYAAAKTEVIERVLSAAGDAGQISR
jgi:GrpB-like predicted nucleotidyltransferase (UPF0157 family)